MYCSLIGYGPDKRPILLELHYANELLERVRLAVQKLLQTRQTGGNNKKLSKPGFAYD